MKKLIYILVIVLTALVSVSCEAERPDDVILSDSTPKLIVAGRTVFSYDSDLCQLAYNGTDASFRMMSDDMSEYVCVTLDHLPSSEGENVVASEMSWTTLYDIEVRNNITLEVLQLKGDIIWLWYRRESIALVLKILESV